MIESLCLAGMLFANLWETQTTRPENTPLTGAASAAGHQCDRSAPLSRCLRPAAPPRCDEPPELPEILRALPSAPRGLPYIYDVAREDVEVRTEKLVDQVDPPCYFPLIGFAQLHHCHWKCTVTFTERIDASFPSPFQIKRRRSEIVYIDKDQIRLCMASHTDDGPGANSSSCPGGRFTGKEIRKDSAKSPSDMQQLVSPPAGAPSEKAGYPKQAFEPLVCPPARDQRNAPMSLSDVVRMSQKGISQEIILRQMELTNAIFNLTVDDIIELHDQGVADQIIRAMQERRESAVVNLQTNRRRTSRPSLPGVIYVPSPPPVIVEPGVSIGIPDRLSN
jgi:hypothetical protein